MEKKGNIFEVPFEGLANVMAKQEAIGDAIFNGLCKKCGEHKEYMMVGIVTVLSVGLFFLITTDAFAWLVENIITGALLVGGGAVGLLLLASTDGDSVRDGDCCDDNDGHPDYWGLGIGYGISPPIIEPMVKPMAVE